MEFNYKGIKYTVWSREVKHHPDDDGILLITHFSIEGHGSGECVTYPLTPANANEAFDMIQRLIDLLIATGELPGPTWN